MNPIIVLFATYWPDGQSLLLFTLGYCIFEHKNIFVEKWGNIVISVFFGGLFSEMV